MPTLELQGDGKDLVALGTSTRRLNRAPPPHPGVGFVKSTVNDSDKNSNQGWGIQHAIRDAAKLTTWKDSQHSSAR